MTIAEFKRKHKLEKLEFYASTVSGSRRFMCVVNPEMRIITKEDYDPHNSEKYIYAADQEEFPGVYWLSNKAKKAADFVE